MASVDLRKPHIGAGSRWPNSRKLPPMASNFARGTGALSVTDASGCAVPSAARRVSSGLSSS